MNYFNAHIKIQNYVYTYLDVDKKKEEDTIILPPPLIPIIIEDEDIDDVDKELEKELENMNFDDIESTVT